MTPAPDPRAAVTQLLAAWNGGDSRARDRLIPIVYADLRRMARRYMRRERDGHSLQPTELVHEAFLRLVDSGTDWQGRGHFFAVAAQVMRRILVDHARTRQASKRGSGVAMIALEDLSVPIRADLDLVALDDALRTLGALDPRQCQVVELRFFGGLSVEETAEVLGISTATVKREWQLAKAWLYRELGA
jgi:RNA polymerase sigma factor (TIGR02999 family)